MVLRWFDTRAVVEFVNATIADIRKLMPQGEHPSSRRQAIKRPERLERVVANTKVFGANNRLNIYKKATLLNTLRWGLREAGYPDDFVDDVVRLIALNI